MSECSYKRVPGANTVHCLHFLCSDMHGVLVLVGHHSAPTPEGQDHGATGRNFPELDTCFEGIGQRVDFMTSQELRFHLFGYKKGQGQSVSEPG